MVMATAKVFYCVIRCIVFMLENIKGIVGNVLPVGNCILKENEKHLQT